ncbi:MAG: hypothetical protein HY651_04125 [Acidobacteria bacterium]|nr:hypothetical protein [Acidobacteriota bacterium]
MERPQRFLTPDEFKALRPPPILDVIYDWQVRAFVLLASIPVLGLAVLVAILIALGGLGIVLPYFLLGLGAIAAALFVARAYNRPFENDVREGRVQSIEGLVEKRRYYGGESGVVGTLVVGVAGEKFTTGRGTHFGGGFPRWDLHRIEEGRRVRLEYLPRSRILLSINVEGSLGAVGEDWRSLWRLETPSEKLPS